MERMNETGKSRGRGRPRLFTPEEAKERNRVSNREGYRNRRKSAETVSLETEKVDRRTLNRGTIKLTDEERAVRKRLYNLNARNKKLAEQGLPLLTLDDIKVYKPNNKKNPKITLTLEEERVLPVVEPVKYKLNVEARYFVEFEYFY